MNRDSKIEGLPDLNALFKDKAHYIDLKDYHYEMREEGPSSIGRLPTANSKESTKDNRRRRKEKEKKDFLRLLEQARVALLKQLGVLQAELEELISKRDIVLDKISALTIFLENYRENSDEMLALDGYPKDPEAREAILDWEKQHGRKFNTESGHIAYSVHTVIADLRIQESEYDEQIDVKQRRIASLSEQIASLDQLEQDYKAGELTDDDMDFELSFYESLDKKDVADLSLTQDAVITRTVQFKPK